MPKNKSLKRDLQAEEWIKKATDDELVGKSILKHRDSPPSIVCFHSQQMAEKYLKAFLVSRKKWYPKIHPLDTLWELCKRLDPSFNTVKKDCVFLTTFYAATRYPGDYPEFSFNECQTAFKAALRVKKFVLKKLEK